MAIRCGLIAFVAVCLLSTSMAFAEKDKTEVDLLSMEDQLATRSLLGMHKEMDHDRGKEFNHGPEDGKANFPHFERLKDNEDNRHEKDMDAHQKRDHDEHNRKRDHDEKHGRQQKGPEEHRRKDDKDCDDDDDDKEKRMHYKNVGGFKGRHMLEERTKNRKKEGDREREPSRLHKEPRHGEPIKNFDHDKGPKRHAEEFDHEKHPKRTDGREGKKWPRPQPAKRHESKKSHHYKGRD